jgi:DNA helicase-2/ATP-dependent DNA helicase PcrA
VTERTPVGEEWEQVYAGAANVIASPIGRVVSASYEHIYVDEYQDCTVSQHALICRLATQCNCKIVGDPLQGIFNFARTELVNWERDVEPQFPRFLELHEPWRWRTSNSKLGNWLRDVRAALIDKRPIDLGQAPIRYVPLAVGQEALIQTRVAKEVAQKAGTTVALLSWPAQCNTLAQRSGGVYSVMEPIESGDLTKHARLIQAASGPARVDAVLAFAAHCATEINATFGTIAAAVRRGDTTRIRKNRSHVTTLEALAREQSPVSLLEALRAIRSADGVLVYRLELYDALIDAVEAWDGDEDLSAVVWRVRNDVRKHGRAVSGAMASRTVLVKGLEFDNVAVLGADGLDARNLYVALTRASRSLTVLARTKILHPG